MAASYHLIGISSAVAWRFYYSRPTRQRDIAAADLQQFDGKDGRLCYVAVDGTVYEIKGFSQWVNGEHLPSGGRARCGRDLSEVIDQAPHGRGILNILPVVGQLTE